ncbi:MAG: glycosyltransferase family 1 protein, partial [Bacteroidaceae bacterium]
MENKLHIISFQVPFPPNYGGVIDVFYKLKSLKDLGYYLILHTYQYKRSKYEKEILSVVDEVY